MAQGTKAKDLREKSPQELREVLESLQREQYVLRMQKATGQLGQSHLARATRREIARIKTVLAEKVAAGRSAQQAGSQST